MLSSLVDAETEQKSQRDEAKTVWTWKDNSGRTRTREDLRSILSEHRLWLASDGKSGQRANLQNFIENIDDECIRYDGGRVAANESLVSEISGRGLRKTTKETGLDRKTIRAILNRKKMKASPLAKVVSGLRKE